VSITGNNAARAILLFLPFFVNESAKTGRPRGVLESALINSQVSETKNRRFDYGARIQTTQQCEKYGKVCANLEAVIPAGTVTRKPKPATFAEVTTKDADEVRQDNPQSGDYGSTPT